jgi:hypothetical protein
MAVGKGTKAVIPVNFQSFAAASEISARFSYHRFALFSAIICDFADVISFVLEAYAPVS